MRHNHFIGSILCAAVASTIACSGYTEIDGYQARYVQQPPPGVEYFPRYPFHDGYVYDVQGRYYHDHNGRWAVYRTAPGEIRNQHPGVRDERGRTEHQR